MTDQTPDREPVARGKSEVLPSVLASHGRVVLDPGCEEVVGTAAVRAREHGEREVVCIDVLDVIERLAERRLGRARNPDLFRDQSIHVRAVGRMPRFRSKHVPDLVSDQAVHQTRFDGPRGDVQGVPILQGFGRAHDRDGDSLAGDGPLQGMPQLGVPRLDGLERGLPLSRTTSTGPVYNGDEHGGRTRGRQKNVCACAMNARDATEPVPSGEGQLDHRPPVKRSDELQHRTRSKALSEISLLIRQSDFWCPNGGHEEARRTETRQSANGKGSGGKPEASKLAEGAVREVPSVLPGENRSGPAGPRPEL